MITNHLPKSYFSILLLFFLGIIPATAQKKSIKPVSDNCQAEQLVLSTFWVQCSGEYRALCYQAYNLATMRLNEVMKLQTEKGKAIVVDLDETFLDNSAFEAMLIQTGKSYSSELWKIWSDKAIATAVPGAIEFAQHAEANGVPIFFISNRKEAEIENTRLNMEKLGFPRLDPDRFLFKAETSSKEGRRTLVSDRYDIILLIGDNLNDFSTEFENRNQNFGFDAVNRFQKEFGGRFIVLPNPMYGDWEGPANQMTDETGSVCNSRKSLLKAY